MLTSRLSGVARLKWSLDGLKLRHLCVSRSVSALTGPVAQQPPRVVSLEGNRMDVMKDSPLHMAVEVLLSPGIR